MTGALRSPARYAEAAVRRATERLSPCFPRGMSLGDLDSFLEIGGHFLVIEWKTAGQDVPFGQLHALTRLAELPQFEVVIVWLAALADPITGAADVTRWRSLAFPAAAEQSPDDPLAALAEHLAAWARYADANPRPRGAGAGYR